MVAIDGSKFSAVNHNSRTYTKEKLQRLIKQIDEKIAEYFTSLDGQDRTDEQRSQPSHGIIQETIANLQTHKAELEELQNTLSESGETQVSLTDPDSRMMRTGNKGADVCYNAQIAVDAKHKLIVAYHLTNEANDLHQLTPMARAAKEALGVEHLDAAADKGYYNETQIAECEQENISCYIPEQEKSQNKALGLYTDRDFTYDAKNDCYFCPANERLNYSCETTKRDKRVRVYATSACRGCLLRARCTRSKRDIYRWVKERVIEAMRERMRHSPEKAAQRKELVEHPFAILKRWMNHEYFLMRGKEKVAAEFSMSVMTYNMKRVLNILGAPALLEALQVLRGTALSFLIYLTQPRKRFFSRISPEPCFAG